MTSQRAAVNRAVKTARRSGWTVERTGKQHWRFRPPAGPLVIAAGSPSDFRAWQNLRSRLRRAGLTL